MTAAPDSPETHGGLRERELLRLGLDAERVLDFSVSVNPFGPLPEVRRAAYEADVSRYPDPLATGLRAALAAHLGISVNRVVAAAGAAQLIWASTTALVRSGDVVLVIGPTFGQYAEAAATMGAEVVEWRLFQGDPPPAAMAPNVVWLCNPNNPTGHYLDVSAIERLRRLAPDAVWIIDEAYLPFVRESQDTHPRRDDPRVIYIRSLTKDCALPGLRLGYLIATPALAQAVDRCLPPWSVSSPAIAAGLMALEHYERIAASLMTLRLETRWLRESLLAENWSVWPSATNFMLIDVRDGAALREVLLREHGIQVRNCASFGLAQNIRVGTRTHADNIKLIDALAHHRQAHSALCCSHYTR